MRLLAYLNATLLSILSFSLIKYAPAQLEVCQSNCESSDRITGPTKMTETKSHPYKVARFPSVNAGFCKLGCQLFYVEVPKDTTCYRLCDYFYRYQVTTGYSDTIEEAKLECRDGCEIAIQICLPGYYCYSGDMLPCPIGTYREAVDDVSLVSLEATKECTLCPRGRYRSTEKGKSADDCNKCPIGKYIDVEGSTKISDCKRCPAGKNAENEGQGECVCITEDSCDFEWRGVTYFNGEVNPFGGIDFQRETVPFIGRH